MEVAEYESELDLLHCRDYQKQAVIGAFNCFDTASSSLIVLPTGMGKTHIGGAICRVWDKYMEGRILWIAHRKELIDQAAGRIERLTGVKPDIEMADSRAMAHGLLSASNVVVASIQSLMAGPKCKKCDGTGGVLRPCEKCNGNGCDSARRTLDGDGNDIPMPCDNEGCEGRGTIATEVDCPFCLGGKVRRLQKFSPGEFGLIVTDEGHHATASTYRRVYRWFGRNPKSKSLGLTATPDRSDEGALGQVFQSVAINIEMPWAIDNGWLVPVTQKSITCEHLDFSNVRTTAGDLNAADLERLLTNEESLHEMVAPTVELAGDRRTLVFCVDKMHTRLVCELINRYKPATARYILGCTTEVERAANFAAHKAGEFQFLVNCGVTTEGYDDPGIQVVAVMRPTKSRALYVQMCGRGIRPIEAAPAQSTADIRKVMIAASVKTEVLILDYVGNAGRHKLITAFDLFSGQYDAEVLDRAKRISAEAGEELPTDEVVRRAQAELDAEEAKRKEIAEHKKREFLKAREAKYKTENVDPFAWWDTLPSRIGAEKQEKEASDSQVSALMRMGVEPFKLAEISASHASVMLDTLTKRRKQDLASYKQAKLLKKNGLNPDITFSQARKVIDALAGNNWRMTDSIRAMAPMQEMAGT